MIATDNPRCSRCKLFFTPAGLNDHVCRDQTAPVTVAEVKALAAAEEGQVIDSLLFGNVTATNPQPVDIVDATIAERGKIYGSPELSHTNIALAWTGILQQHYQIKLDHPIPAWLCELMMVAFKVNRSARVFHEDNYTDLKAYAKFAEEDQRKAFDK